MNKEITIEGKKIFYRVAGTGKPVMLVHGFGEDGEVWNQQLAFLQPDFKVIIPDLPGSGRSAIIDDMSMEGLAEVLKRIVHIELGESSPGKGISMIGHSMGGYIALAFAEKYPERLTALGLFHSSAFADNEEKKTARQKGIEFIEEKGAFEFLETATPKLFSPLTKDERPGLVDEQIASLSNFSPHALVLYYRSMMQRPDRTAVLKKIRVPVLFIMGKYDSAVPPEDGLKQSHLPEKSYIHMLQQSGHMGMLEEPQKSNRVLKNFLLES